MKERVLNVLVHLQTMTERQTVYRRLECRATSCVTVFGRLAYALDKSMDAVARGAVPAAAAAFPTRTIVRVAA